MSQWYTVDAVTRPSFEGVIHFQNTTGWVIWKLFILDFISRLKICRLSPVAPATVALRAMTFEAGFINAESAVMGRFRGVSGEAMSTITTEFDGPVSRMQMNLSLSIVTLVKEMNCWLMPRLGSCTYTTSLSIIGGGIARSKSAFKLQSLFPAMPCRSRGTK